MMASFWRSDSGGWTRLLPVMMVDLRAFIRPMLEDRAMTEAEWLTSTDPAAMLRHVEKTATKAQQAAFLEAAKDHAKWAVRQTQQNRNEMLCHFYRDIFGNPFRRVLVGIPEDGLTSFNLAPGAHTVDWLDPDILSWNDSTIPKLARSIGGGELCKALATNEVSYDNDGTISERCSICHGTGKTPPRFEDMPILADALMEAGVPEDSELVKHCQGLARCHKCLKTPGDQSATGEQGLGRDDSLYIPRGNFKCVNKCDMGWLRSDTPHVRGCFVLELLIGGDV